MQTHRVFLFFVLICSLLAPSYSPLHGKSIATAATASTALASWLDVQQSEDVVYLLYSTPASIKRYRISNETWLSDISLSGTPTAFRVTADGIYVAFGRRTAKLQLDGSGETHLFNTAVDIHALYTAAQILYVNHSAGLYGNFTSFNLSTFTIIQSVSYYPYSMYGTSFAPNLHKIFGRTSGLSPDDIVQVIFTAEGLFTGQDDSPYHGDYSRATKTWVSPDETIVVDNSGTIYNTASLIYRGSLGGALSDLAFYDDQPIVLRNGTLIAYSNVYLETGRTTPSIAVSNIIVSGDCIYGFYSGASGPQVIKIPISELTLAPPGAAVDPNGLSYSPDRIEVGSDEIIYLLSRQHRNIFRWSVAQRRYLSSIPLIDIPYTFTYAPNENRLYTVYQNGSIFKIDLSGDLLEKAFANLPAAPCGLSTAESFVFACDGSGAYATHTVISPSGEIISTKDWNYTSSEYIWNSPRRKMYFITEHFSPNDLMREDIDASGVLGVIKDSPYHGDISLAHPIRVKADGSLVLVASGRIFDGLTLYQVNTLSNNISDAAWKGDTLLTMRPSGAYSELQQWTPVNYGIAGSKMVKGAPLRLFPVGEGWLVITNLAGRVLQSGLRS